LHEPDRLIGAANALADRIARQDPLAIRLTKKVMHAPRAAHPFIDELAQSVLFEAPAKHDRMRAFLDKKKGS
jgi:enoyl-CoA hydratase